MGLTAFNRMRRRLAAERAAAEAADQAAEEPAVSGTSGSPQEVADYDSMKRAELLGLARERGLEANSKSTKRVLVRQLREADQA